jgi:hypothetical protein
MNTRVLHISNHVRAEIAALKAKAAEPGNVTKLATVVEMAGKQAKGEIPSGFNEAHVPFTMAIPHGFYVTYTHEEQHQCTCRHISVSVESGPGKGPHPTAFGMLLREFGFVNTLDGKTKPYIWTSTTPGGRLVIEAIEPLDGDMHRLQRSA